MIDQHRCGYFLMDGVQCSVAVDPTRYFCPDHEECTEADIDVYKSIGEHFRQDLKEFWTRFNFYLIVQGALLTVSTQALISPKTSRILFNAMLDIFGLVIAIHWYMVAVSSIIWCNTWGREFVRIQRVVDKRRTYEHAEQQAENTAYWTLDPLARRMVFIPRVHAILSQRRPLNPNRNAVYLPLIFAGSWIVLLVVLVLHLY